MSKTLAQWAGIIGSLGVVFGALAYFDMTPALSGDIKKLERKQLQYAIPNIEDRLDRFIIRRGQIDKHPDNGYYAREKQSLDRQIERLKHSLRGARARQEKLGP